MFLFLLNTLPDTADITYGFFRKLLIVPFNKAIGPEERDGNLLEKLVLELPGVLNWAVQGLQRLRENRYQFSSCTKVDALMREYRSQQNPTGEFFREYYQPSEGGRIKKSDIYPQYAFWMEQNGECPTNSIQFWKMLRTEALNANSGITLKMKKVHGFEHLVGYTYREEHKPGTKLEINF